MWALHTAADCVSTIITSSAQMTRDGCGPRAMFTRLAMLVTGHRYAPCLARRYRHCRTQYCTSLRGSCTRYCSNSSTCRTTNTKPYIYIHKIWYTMLVSYLLGSNAGVNFKGYLLSEMCLYNLLSVCSLFASVSMLFWYLTITMTNNIQV